MGNHSGWGGAALGRDAGNGMGGSNYSIAIGFGAYSNITANGNNNIVIGYQANVSSSSASNEITFGNDDITKLRVPGIGLTFTSIGAEITGIVTATTFSGNLTGTASTATTATNVTLGNKQLAFRIEGPGIHDNDWKYNTNLNGNWTNEKVFNEGGNAIFNSTDTRTYTITKGGATITVVAEVINDGGEYDSNWYISSWTGELHDIGTTFQSTQNGGRGNVVIKFKVEGTPDTITTDGGDFTKDAEYTGSLSSAVINVRAGWGIIDRAAMVGIIISKRKDVLYEPIFTKEENIIGMTIKQYGKSLTN